MAYESKWTYFLLALVPSLCDCGLAWLVYRAAKRSSRGVKEHTALVLTAFTAFNPLMLFDTGVWKQIDGAFALPLVLCFVLLEQRRYLPAAVLYGVALAIKPQALLFGPVLAVCYLAAIALEKDRLRAFGRCFGGAALALLPPLLTGLPFLALCS
ncbi:glycosyltransferase 87 family protein [Gemmiger formicilis]|nr:glycosyltransferase 87 family protein [Gemmiger formicilis]